MSRPEERMPGLDDLEDEVLDFDDEPQDVEDTDDGGAIVRMSEDEGPERAYEFYDNIVEMFEEHELNTIAVDLLECVDRDKKTRERRDAEYAEAVKRTGLGKEAPGGAEFTGASRAVYPMLTEASVDYSARAIKELMPPDGPVKTYVPGKNVSTERLHKADRKRDYMNWQFITQMPEFRPELEQMLPQLALAGSQYIRLVPDWSKRKTRPLPQFIPQDLISIPYSASNFYTAERQTYHEPVTRFEFEARVRDGMYRDIGQLVDTQPPEETESQKAADRVEGKEDTDFYNQDGIRIVEEVSCWLTSETDPLAEGKPAPYMVSIDRPTRKIVAIVRNWEEDDEYCERMQWIVEFSFIPWRGAYSIGLGQMIGSLSGAATGALRALLDSAHVNNVPTAIRLKGSNFIGQTKSELQATEIIEIQGGLAGDDIRKLIMPLPFNPPSQVLYSLLGFLVDAGRGVVRTTYEKLNDAQPNMPVGTTLALIEEGMQVLSAIHLRAFHSMTYLIRILHRIDKMYITDEEVKNDIGEVLAKRSDFQGPLDVVPTADPQIFSDVQRLAQLQIVADRAAAMPGLYNQRAVEKRLLERTKIPNPDELLVPENLPEEQNPVNENAAMTLGRPVSAFPEQDHLAHIQVHLDFLLSPTLGQLPIIAPTFVGAVLDHLKEHLVLWYVSENYQLLQATIGTGEEGMREIMNERDGKTRNELERTLAAASPTVIGRSGELFKSLPQIVQQAIQLLQQYQPKPQIPEDPNKMAAIQQRAAADAAKDQTKRLEISSKERTDFARLSADQRREQLTTAREQARMAAERAARLEQLEAEERAEDERVAAKIASDERRNTQDNATALRIAAAELEADRRSNLETGTGINP